VKRLALLLVLTAACAAPPPPPPTVTPTPAERPAGSVWVTASTLNVRSDASADAKVVTRVRRGTKLTIVAEESGWIRVRLANGDLGWVSAQHVSRSEPARAASRRGGCPPDSDYAFVKSPVPAFSDRGAHGLVVVEAFVNTKGEVTSTKVISNTTGDEALAFLTEREIRSARFSPPIRNCVPRTFIFTYKRSF
jgi:uncharacterized protein YgiM (DUF1202 family)